MVIITGVSSGIGHALALDYLSKGNKVIGLGRRNSIDHKNFEFKECNLSNPSEIDGLKFDFSDVEHLTLINNAGILGTVGRLSELAKSDAQEVLSVNTIAPILLTHKILLLFPNDRALTIVNISSGAGKRAIPSWASYCASKAALDLFSLTLLEEELERGRNFKIYSISPGVVDTKMQDQIRSSNPSTFSGLQTFINFKEHNELYSLELVVQKFANLLSQPYNNEVIYSLRDY